MNTDMPRFVGILLLVLYGVAGVYLIMFAQRIRKGVNQSWMKKKKSKR